MAFYQYAADRIMRELGIQTIGGMLTRHERDQRSKMFEAESLLDVDTEKPTLVARLRMQLATRASAAPFAVLLGAEEKQAFKEALARMREERAAGTLDPHDPIGKKGHPLVKDFDTFALQARDSIYHKFVDEWSDTSNRLKDFVRGITKKLTQRNKNHPDIVRAVNTFSSSIIEHSDESFEETVAHLVEKTLQQYTARLCAFAKAHDAEAMLAYRERTQWVKQQYASDLKRIRAVQEKLFEKARSLQKRTQQAEQAAKQAMAHATANAGPSEPPYCAKKSDHVKRMAVQGGGMIKELSADLARLQAEMEELRSEMAREKGARMAAESAARAANDRAREKEMLLEELRAKSAAAAKHLKAREAELAEAKARTAELQEKWQAAESEVAARLKVINALKSKNRKLDGQRLAEKKALQAKMSKLLEHHRSQSQHPAPGDGGGSAAHGTGPASNSRSQRLGAAAERLFREKNSRGGRRALKGEDLQFRGPHATVTQVDCHCTCGAELEAATTAAAGAAAAAGGRRSLHGHSSAPVQHLETCALFAGDTAPVLQAAPLRTAASTVCLTAQYSDEEDVVSIHHADDLDLSTYQQHQQHMRRTPSHRHPRIAGRGMVLRSADSVARGVSFSGMAGVQAGAMRADPVQPVQYDPHTPEAQVQVAVSGADAPIVDLADEKPPAVRPLPAREAQVRADGYVWSPGGGASNSYRTWMMRHKKALGTKSSRSASFLARNLREMTSPASPSTLASSPLASSLGSTFRLQSGAAASLNTATAGTPVVAVRGHHAPSTGADANDANGGADNDNDDDHHEDDPSRNTVAALAAAHEERLRSQAASPHPTPESPAFTDTHGTSYFDLRAPSFRRQRSPSTSIAASLAATASLPLSPAPLSPASGRHLQVQAQAQAQLHPLGNSNTQHPQMTTPMRVPASATAATAPHDTRSTPLPSPLLHTSASSRRALRKPGLRTSGSRRDPLHTRHHHHSPALKRTLTATTTTTTTGATTAGAPVGTSNTPAASPQQVATPVRASRRGFSMRVAGNPGHTAAQQRQSHKALPRAKVPGKKKGNGKGSGKGKTAEFTSPAASAKQPLHTERATPVTPEKQKGTSGETAAADEVTHKHARHKVGTGHSFVATPAPADDNATSSGAAQTLGQSASQHVVSWERAGHTPDGSRHVVHTGFSPSTFAPPKPVVVTGTAGGTMPQRRGGGTRAARRQRPQSATSHRSAASGTHRRHQQSRSRVTVTTLASLGEGVAAVASAATGTGAAATAAASGGTGLPHRRLGMRGSRSRMRSKSMASDDGGHTGVVDAHHRGSGHGGSSSSSSSSGRRKPRPASAMARRSTPSTPTQQQQQEVLGQVSARGSVLKPW